jgi:serine/arginine repetitive matrix protein 2
LFSRKKSKLSSSNNNSSNDSSPSPTTVYITSDKSLPSSPNGIPTSSVYPSIAASSSKLRLPFTRKKYNPANSTTSIATHSHNHPSESQSTFGSPSPSPPRPSYLTRTSNVSASDSDTTSILDHRRRRPPPSKSAIFAAYADPHVALSTRSLPDDRSSSRRPETPPPPLPLQVPPPNSKDRDKDHTKNTKKPSFFHWGSKSTPNTPLSIPHNPPTSAPATQNQSPHYVKKNLPDSPTEDKSFNLKAFRHISNGTNYEDVSVSQGQGMGAPRPRGTSITSESSQRISVAAFREAQARRSTADSPVPSFRAPSPGPGHGKGMGAGSGFSSANNSPFGSPNLSSRSPRDSLNQNQNYRLDPKRRSSNLAFTSESDESSSEEEEEDSDDDIRSASVSQHRRKKPEAPIANTSNKEGLNRQRTVTKRNSGNTDDRDTDRPRFRATKSESGHTTSLSSSHVFPGRNDSFTPSPAAPPVPAPPPVSGSRSWFTGGKQIFGNGNASDAQIQKIREEPQPRSQSSLGFTSSTRKRASMSVSAIMPNAAAKRASVIVAEGGEYFLFSFLGWLERELIFGGCRFQETF